MINTYMTGNPIDHLPYKIIHVLLYYSNSQIKSCHYTLLYRNHSSIWFYMCSTVQSPQAVLNGVINLLSGLCYQTFKIYIYSILYINAFSNISSENFLYWLDVYGKFSFEKSVFRFFN